MDTIAVVVADEQWLAQLTECCNASWHAAKQHDGALFSQPPPIPRVMFSATFLSYSALNQPARRMRGLPEIR